MIARLKKFGAFYVFGIAMFSLGCIVEAVMITVPRIAYMVLGQ